jgi:GcrA cell cycle regulator
MQGRAQYTLEEEPPMTEEMLRDPGPQQIEPPAEAAWPSTRCTLMQLTSRTCRWPIGDPRSADFCFCGATSVRGRPYCDFHLGVAYAPPQRR